MKKTSLKERIKNFILKQDGLINGGEIERLCLANGYKASNGSRRCRELENGGIIKAEYINGSVWYKVNEDKFRKVQYYVPSLEKEIITYEKI